MKIGKYEISSINTGEFCLDGGAMFGIIPKPLWEKTNLSDDRNRVVLNSRCLLLENGSRKILIDTGIGSNWDEKFMDIYRIDQTQNSLFNSFEKQGIKSEEITDVILTHLHFDHTGGAVLFSEGEVFPAFPNAKYYVQKKHFDWAKNPSEKDKGSFVQDRFIPLAEEGVLQFIENEEYFDDEIELILFDGHTPAQQLLKISDSSNTLFYCGDLIPFSSHLRLPYIMSFDLNPLKTLSEKKIILKKALIEDWILIFEHDPYNIAVKIEERGKKYSVKENVEI